MKFVMKVKQKGMSDAYAWDEPMSKDHLMSAEAARKYCEHIVSNWNASTDAKKHRVLVDVIIDEASMDPAAYHNWEKVNLVTIHDSSGLYDKYICKKCGCDGKRRSLSSPVVRDGWCSAKVYERCDTAKKQIAKTLEKRRLAK